MLVWNRGERFMKHGLNEGWRMDLRDVRLGRDARLISGRGREIRYDLLVERRGGGEA